MFNQTNCQETVDTFSPATCILWHTQDATQEDFLDDGTMADMHVLGSESMNDTFWPEGNHDAFSSALTTLQDILFSGAILTDDSDESLFLMTQEQNDLDMDMPIFNEHGIILKEFDLKHPPADRRMSILRNPETPYHPRYATDGIRRAQKMRKNPIEIQLPYFLCKNIDQGIKAIMEVTLATSENNPLGQKLLHVHKLGYLGGQALEINDQCLQIPLNESDLASGVAKFPNLSITRQLHRNINYDIRKLSPITPHGEVFGKYEKPTCSRFQSASALAKNFIRDFDLLDACLVFRVLLKHQETIRRTDIQCSTILLREQEVRTTRSRHRQ